MVNPWFGFFELLTPPTSFQSPSKTELLLSTYTIEDLTQFDLVYLASPYSKYPAGIEAAFQDVSRIAARLMEQGVKVYSPIAHTHPLAIYGGVDPLNHNIWLPFDEAIMRKSDAIVVAMMDTWKQSYGVNHEIEFFTDAGKPVFYLDTHTGAIDA